MNPCAFAVNNFLALIAIFLFVCPASAADSQLVIFHTNDVHGYALAAKGSANKLNHIGYARVNSFVNTQAVRYKTEQGAGHYC